MSPEERQELEQHLNAIAKILSQNTDPSQLQDFESIELAAREHLLIEVSPKIGEFFFNAGKPVGTGRVKKVKSCVGIVKVKSKKAQKLGLKKGARRSPVLEKCCLLLSANESFQNAERDVELLTGIKIGHSSQHRWVQEEKWTEPVVKGVVSELSIDGGKVRLRTAEQGECGRMLTGN
jgi:hypothetical protein